MHKIRLRGPWQCVQAGNTETVSLPLTLSDIPFDSKGEFELRRSFNRPTGLLEGTKVTLVVEGNNACSIYLNDAVIDESHQSSAASRFEITRYLRANNQLRFAFERDSSSVSLLQDVRLEIADN